MRRSVSAATRDRVLDMIDEDGEASMQTVDGGKVITGRRLAEPPHWRDSPLSAKPLARQALATGAALPGGAVARFEAFFADVRKRRTCLAETTTLASLGRDFGAGWGGRELARLVATKWARMPGGILWRRSTRGLRLGEAVTILAADLGRREAA